MVGHNQVQHEPALRGAWVGEAAGGPMLIQRTEEDFVGALLHELSSTGAEVLIEKHRVQPVSAVKDKQGREGGAQQTHLRLHQPVHRVFNLVLVEAYCKTFMSPRLDPTKIDSAGLVVRRVCENNGILERDSRGRYICQGWFSQKGRTLGWKRFPVASLSAEDDPLPEHRHQQRITGNGELDRRLFGGRSELAEAVTPVFVSPPNVAAATGRTLLYGVVPVTSASRAGSVETPAPSEQAAWDKAWTDHLSPLLKAGSFERDISWPEETLRRATLENPTARASLESQDFMVLLQQLSQEFGVFRQGSRGGVELLKMLNEVQVGVLVSGKQQRRRAGDYVAEAASVLVLDDPPSTSVPRPLKWPEITAELAGRLHHALQRLAQEATSLIASDPGRFDDASRYYVAQPFIRVKCPNNCPPKVVWCEPTEPFRIAPWYEAGPVAPAAIRLPEITKDFLQNAKPGVAFSVPRDLFNLLRGNPKDLLDGRRPSGPGLALDWICGFNIPVITICAFILLSIVLAILNILFWWLPFVKICIPFPRRGP